MVDLARLFSTAITVRAETRHTVSPQVDSTTAPNEDERDEEDVQHPGRPGIQIPEVRVHISDAHRGDIRHAASRAIWLARWLSRDVAVAAQNCVLGHGGQSPLGPIKNLRNFNVFCET